MTLPASFAGPHSWRAPSPALLAHVDLSGLVENGLVTSVQVQPDGAIVIECPHGLPADLAGQVEPVIEEVEDRLARLERGLTRLTMDLAERERITDRLDAVEFGLTERLQGVIAEELLHLAVDQAEEAPSLNDRVDAILAAVQNQGSDQGSPAEAEILTRIEELCARPFAQPDLTPMRQMNSRFLQAMSQVMTRLEAAVEVLQQPASDGLADLSEQVAALASKVETLRPMGDLTDALGLLADQIAAQEMRPAPVLDLTEQRQSFASFATVLSAALRRIEAVSDSLASPDDGIAQEIGQISSQLQELGAGIAALDPTPLQTALASLTERIAALEARPQPKPDLTEQRKSFAGFATALGATLRRIDAVADRWEASQPGNQDLAQALETLHARLDRELSTLAPQLSAKIDALAEQERAAVPGLMAKLDAVLAAQEAARPDAMAQTLPVLSDKLDALLSAQQGDALDEALPEVSQKLDALLAAQRSGNSDRLAEAILALAGRVQAPGPALSGLESFHAAQQDFFQDLRFLLAEIVATQTRLQAAS